MGKQQASITAIHVCSGGVVYVERAGEWYRINQPGQGHTFAEISQWSETLWKSKLETPPCFPSVTSRRMG
jgi:hypothetical protein